MYRRRNDGIFVFNLGKTWEKLQLAARIIVAIENPQDIVAISARPYGQRAVLKFANYTGAKATVGRHTPGEEVSILAAHRCPPLLRLLCRWKQLCAGGTRRSQPSAAAAAAAESAAARCSAAMLVTERRAGMPGWQSVCQTACRSWSPAARGWMSPPCCRPRAWPAQQNGSAESGKPRCAQQPLPAPNYAFGLLGPSAGQTWAANLTISVCRAAAQPAAAAAAARTCPTLGRRCQLRAAAS